MILAIGIGLVAVIALLLVVVALQPGELRVERRTTIDAPRQVVFPMVRDLHVFDAWSPFGKLDPNIQKTFSGAAQGKGAVYAWAGDRTVGSGRMEITDERPNERVTMRLDFITPFKATNTADFTLTPAGNGTTVTWLMTGEKNFVSKAVGLFMNMDTMIGGEFEKGLAELKRLAEQKA